MRIGLLLIVWVCAVSAKYLSDDGRNSLSNPNKEDKSNQVDPWETRNQEEIQKQIKHNEKEGRKHEEEQRNYQEKLTVEKKLTKKEQLEKLTIKKWKRTRKEEREETERKRKQLQQKIQSVLNRLENDSKEKRKHVSINKSHGDYIDDNDVDQHENWKNYVYKKYGLTELSGGIKKKAALIRYVQEELLERNAEGTETPAFRDSVFDFKFAALVDSTAAPPAASVGLHAPLPSDAAPAPVVPIAPESAVAPRVDAAVNAVVAIESAAGVETSSVRWPTATPAYDYNSFIFPYEPYSDFDD